MRPAALLSALAPPLCWSCGRSAGEGRALCGTCRSMLRWEDPGLRPAAGVAAWAPVVYEGPARALVRALKFRGATGLAGVLAAAMAAGAPDGLLAGALAPVPLAASRRRKRGFNQAERLAAELGGRSGLAVADVLRRRGRPGPQSLLGRGERLAAAPGSVALARGRSVPARVLLVDDVITTGATLAACARALRDAGAEEVLGIAYARTPGR